MNTAKLKITMFLVILFVISGMISCSKKTEQKITEDGQVVDVEKMAVAENDFNENDEDLLKVDYKEFYDDLAPHGEWIEVTDKDIDAAMKKETASNDGHRTISFSDLFGVKDAMASDAAFGAFFVWKPSPDISVGIAAGEPAVTYVPYTNGQWVYTDAGWYFNAATDYEEITHHHGRWVYSPAMGWVWVPGRVWAPAWVDWRENEDYLAWEPIPPSVYIVNNVIVTPPVYEERYVFVERRHFCDPFVYNYCYSYKEHGNHFKIHDMRRLDGIMVVNNTVINHGPDVNIYENIRGSKIERYKINRVNNIKDVKISGNEINSYSPKFTKVKTKGNLPQAYSKPEKFDKYNDIRSKNNNKNDISSNNSGKADEKTRLQNDNDMKNGKNKGNDKNSFKDKNNNKQDKGNSNKDKKYNNGGKNRDKEIGGEKKDKGKGNRKDKGYNTPKGKDNGNNTPKSKDKNKNKNDGSYDKGGKNKDNGNQKQSPNTRKGGKNKSNNNDGNIKGRDRGGKQHDKPMNKNEQKKRNDNFKEKGKDTKPPRDKNSSNDRRNNNKQGNRKK